MQYNTKRKPLIIPEYGRHVQKMVAHAVTLEDKTLNNLDNINNEDTKLTILTEIEQSKDQNLKKFQHFSHLY